MTAPAMSRRRPKFGDIVILGSERYRVCAAVVAPTRGYWIRPESAADADRDRLLTLGDWSVLAFSTKTQRWESA